MVDQRGGDEPTQDSEDHPYAKDEDQHRSQHFRRGGAVVSTGVDGVVPVERGDEPAVERADDGLQGGNQGDETPTVHPQVMDEVGRHHNSDGEGNELGKGVPGRTSDDDASCRPAVAVR